MTAAAALQFRHYPISYNAVSTPSVSTELVTLSGKAFQEQSKAARTPALFAVHNSLDALSAIPAGWDGHGSMQPAAHSIANARQFVEASAWALRGTPNATWRQPHVSANESGDVAFEWWNGPRKLTAYVAPDAITYIKSWGPDPIADMEDGELSASELIATWAWLYS